MWEVDSGVKARRSRPEKGYSKENAYRRVPNTCTQSTL
jgi:hypothetical protein